MEMKWRVPSKQQHQAGVVLSRAKKPDTRMSKPVVTTTFFNRRPPPLCLCPPRGGDSLPSDGVFQHERAGWPRTKEAPC